MHGPDASVQRSGTTTEAEFTPVEELVLDTLAARLRLGEAVWTFDVRLEATLESLAARRLIDVVGVPVGPTVRARLTTAGMAVTMDETYASPIERPDVDSSVEAEDLADLTIVRCAGGVAWQKLMTIDGPRWFSTIPDSSHGPFTSAELVARRGPVTVVSVPALH